MRSAGSAELKSKNTLSGRVTLARNSAKQQPPPTIMSETPPIRCIGRRRKFCKKWTVHMSRNPRRKRFKPYLLRAGGRHAPDAEGLVMTDFPPDYGYSTVFSV
jgi:hypothetical protein